ncbi:hypothetical protein, conserved [Angomonas deanei]|uniref:Uncharacterized protein n=1 Tax=Angomonas deanei TaxID=59799 RepID=A0A7G2CAQ2_9TRYP|nr:hypothetical protein, conserved [Angomonas deanei]
MCEETANALLEEDQQKMESAAPPPPQETPLYSAREGEPEEEQATQIVAKAKGITTERLQASYVLVAGCAAAMQDRSHMIAKRGVDLALRAVEIHHSRLTTAYVAFACYNQGTMVQERNSKEELFSLAAKTADTICGEIAAEGSATREDIGCFARLCWLLAFLGHVETVRSHVSNLLRMDGDNYLGLLLLALLHTVDSSFDKSALVLARLQSLYTDDIPSALLSTAVKVSSRANPQYSPNFIMEDLAVALARLTEQTKAVQEEPLSKDRKKSVKALTMHCAPGENNGEEFFISSQERKRHTAGHWALLSHVAVRSGAQKMAEVAVEAGVSFIVKETETHPRALADLLCCSARRNMMLIKQQQQLGDHSVRELNLLSTLTPMIEEEEASPVGGFSLTASVRGSATRKLPYHPSERARQVIVNEMESIRTQLLKALEVHPGHSEAYSLLATLQLLEIENSTLSEKERAVKLTQAEHFFTNAIRCQLLSTEGHQGLGVVREAQGATEASVDFYASASDLEMKAPLVDFRRFAYLFM